MNFPEDKLNPNTVTDTSGQTSTATTSLALSAADAAILDIGYLLQPDTSVGTGEVMQVTALTSTSATVTRGYGGSTKASTATNTVMRIVGTPTYENSDLGKDFSRARIAKTNYIQRFEVNVNLSSELIVRSLMGYAPGVQDELAYQFKQRMMERRRDMINALWFSWASSSSPASTGGDYSSMWGLWKWLDGTSTAANTTSVIGASTGTFTDTTINTIAQNILKQGGNCDTLCLPSTLIARVGQLYSDRIRIEQGERTRGFLAKYYLTPYGFELRLVLDPALNDTAGSLQAAVLDLGRIRIRPFATQFFYIIKAPSYRDGDAIRALSKWSLEIRNTGTDAGYSHQIMYGMS